MPHRKLIDCACCGLVIAQGEEDPTNENFHCICLSDNGLTIAERRQKVVKGRIVEVRDGE